MMIIINFMCQLGRAKGYPGSWQNIISEWICESVFVNLAFDLVDWEKNVLII